MNLHLPPPSVTVRLPRPGGGASVTLRPLPIGFHRRLKERGLVPPSAPRRAARDSAGRVLRDDAGLAVLTEDDATPAHLAAVDRYQERLAALMIAESLGDETALETPAPESDVGDWPAYADAVLAELSEAGVTPGELAALCRGVCEASRLVGPAVAAEGESLFPCPAAAAP